MSNCQRQYTKTEGYIQEAYQHIKPYLDDETSCKPLHAICAETARGGAVQSMITANVRT